MAIDHITRRDFINGAALSVAAGLTPAAQIAAQPGALSAVAARTARPARRLVRGRACLRARPRELCGRESAGRGALRSRRGRRRHQRACRRVVLSPRARRAGAHPHPRQSRRFRRPRQAQRVHARWPPGHRLWRQPVDRLSRIPGGATPARACCASSASTCGASRPRSSAISIRRSVCRAACSFAREAFGRDLLVTGDSLIMSGNAIDAGGCRMPSR